MAKAKSSVERISFYRPGTMEPLAGAVVERMTWPAPSGGDPTEVIRVLSDDGVTYEIHAGDVIPDAASA